MSEPEAEDTGAEDAPAEGGAEPMPDAVPDDYLDQKPFDPSGR